VATVIKNIGYLFTGKRVLEEVDLLIEDGRVKDIGNFPGSGYDAQGRTVIPGFVDCHTHLVFAGDRSDELEMRLQGRSYLDIARAGGGIMRTVQETRKAPEDLLFSLAKKRLERLQRLGTTTIEIKSGYGLTVEDEIKILRVIRRLKTETPIEIVATFLGAHIVPEEVSREHYISTIIEEILPRIREENLADFCDVFCDEGAYSIEETEEILKAAKDLGFKLKVHAEELTHTGVSSLAANLGAISCDHLNHITREDLLNMKKNGTVAVLLPGTSLFLNCGKPPITEILNSGVDIAIASDYNPGTCPILSIPIILALGCLYYRIPIYEAMVGVTAGGGRAIGRKEVGMLEKNYFADLIVLDIPNMRQIVYGFDQDNIVAIFKKGNIIIER